MQRLGTRTASDIGADFSGVSAWVRPPAAGSPPVRHVDPRLTVPSGCYGIHTFNCVMAMRKPAAMEAN